MSPFHIVAFLIFQVAANLFFKWGSTAPHLFWWGFGFGNLIGASSIVFMIMMYRSMPAALVIAIGTGGSFLLNQITVHFIFREHLSWGGGIGLGLILIGIILTSLLSHPDAAEEMDKQAVKKLSSRPDKP